MSKITPSPPPSPPPLPRPSTRKNSLIGARRASIIDHLVHTDDLGNAADQAHKHNEYIVEHVSLWNILWIPAGSVLGGFSAWLSFGSFTFDDPRISSTSWFPCAFSCGTVWIGLLSALFIANFFEIVITAHPWLTDGSNARLRRLVWTRLMLAPLLGSCVLFSIWYLFAVLGPRQDGMELSLMPFHGVLAAIPSALTVLMVILYSIPKEGFSEAVTRQEEDPKVLWRRGTFCVIFSFVTTIGMIIPYWGVSIIFFSIPSSSSALRNIVVCLFTALRKCLQLAVETLVKKGVMWVDPDNHDTISGFVLAQVFTVIQHITFLSVVMSSSEWSILFVIAGADAVACMVSLLQVTDKLVLPWVAKNPELRKLYRVKNATYMALAEPLEAVIPLTYIAATTLCRIGPNGTYLGGIGVSMWHFKDAEDNAWVKGLVWFVMDMTILVGTFFVAEREGVKVVRILANCCAQYKLQIFFSLAFLIEHQICITAFHCGMDFTLNFDFYDISVSNSNATQS
mmetsp:Transcript_16254/g.33430  ORF Transcript_16254/g.33430 Transcript_16254/m.33430 type:complete len:510 (+) Transcript_16254:11-1540(+)